MADPARLDRERAFWDRRYAADRDPAFRPPLAGSPEARLWRRAADLPVGTRLVSLGGGVDRWGLQLVRQGLRVASVELSSEALRTTRDPADRTGSGPFLIQGDAHRLPLATGTWDVVLARSALHHLEPAVAAREIARVLRPGGQLLALEPICLPAWLQRLHRRFPYRPQFEVSPDEIELGDSELADIRCAFSRLEVEPLGCLLRPSVNHLLGRFRLDFLRPGLLRLDRALIRCIPGSGRLAGQALLRGIR